MRCLLFTLLMALGICAGARAGRPEGLGLAALGAARDYSLKQGGKALLVEQDGDVVLESYAVGTTAADKLKIYSGTKLYWCLAALAAVDDGLLKLDAPIAKTLPAWADVKGKSELTLRQLLDFSSGLGPAFELHQDGLADRDAMALRQPIVAARGAEFIYGPCGLQVFHAALAVALQGKHETPTHYLERRVLKPLRLGPQRYVADAAGHPLLAAGFTQSAREWLRLGRVIMREGHNIVRDETFAEALRGSRVNAAFGLGIWNNRAASDAKSREVDVEAMLHKKWQQQSWSRVCLSHAAPADLLACIGSHGQRLYVVPSRGLIVVRLATGDGFDDAAFLRRLFAVGK